MLIRDAKEQERAHRQAEKEAGRKQNRDHKGLRERLRQGMA